MEFPALKLIWLETVILHGVPLTVMQVWLGHADSRPQARNSLDRFAGDEFSANAGPLTGKIHRRTAVVQIDTCNQRRFLTHSQAVIAIQTRAARMMATGMLFDNTARTDPATMMKTSGNVNFIYLSRAVPDIDRRKHDNSLSVTERIMKRTDM